MHRMTGTFRAAIFSGCRPLWLLPIATYLALAPMVSAAADPTEVCDAAAHHVARESSVPIEVLRAITRTETGRGTSTTLDPWPWTVNMQGRGVWFDTQSQAQAYVFRHFKNGARSFDIGCFQINYKWHGHAFASIEEMFDPIQNARYAARFLAKLYQEHGDWTKAAGAYHSRTAKYADSYLERYAAIRDDLSQSPNRETNSLARSNAFPLFRASSVTPSNGSLVPLGNSPARNILLQDGGE